MAHLTYVNLFANDIIALSKFYIDVFSFKNIPEMESPIYRGIAAGEAGIGFNAHEAYELLHLSEYADVKGIKSMITIDVDSVEDVERMVPIAVSHGAKLIKEPYKTYYNWYQAVLLDPEGNVFRINRPLD